jgi:D-alanyl-lipoteichoic acid acyltransferase DltB (MBOAT superfamily)
MMLWGLFMKLVIADRLAIYVNAVYNNADHHTGQTLALATVFFAFQIYCDFAGYSNIAIGAAKVMGFKLMTNFNRPYFSRSISEFWKRWHISLSTWFRDYLYISLGGNRVTFHRWYFNLLIVFVISGLWHGANRTFIIWGAINGLYLVFAIVTEKLRKRIGNLLLLNKEPRINNFLQIVITFLLACFAWVFFRAGSGEEAIMIIKKILLMKGPIFIGTPSVLIYSFFAIAFLLVVELKAEYFNESIQLLHSRNALIRKLSYSFLIIIILMIGVFDGGQFIYFQF